MSTQDPVEKAARLRILAAYYATLLILIVASFLPEYRLWGVNWWAFYPLPTRLILFAIGSVVPWAVIAVLNLSHDDERELDAAANGMTAFYVSAGLLSLAVAAGFYLLRAKTFFLGDGYPLLSYLGKEDPFIKGRGLGEALIHVWVKLLIGGSGEAGALVSFRIVSIGAGLLFLVTSMAASARLYARPARALLFFLGLISGGYLLLFFGYVEYYSLFALAITIFTLVGLLIAAGQVNRWFIVAPLGLAVFLHIFGVTLIPAALYLLISGSRFGRRLARTDRKSKLLLLLLGAIAVVAAFVYYYSVHPFFRFSLVPILENRFTVEGYTLLSPKHLVDYANLLFLLVPGLLVVLAAVWRSEPGALLRQRPIRFLIVLALSTLATAFVFDPKLGMPRDWDLFAYCGIPLAALAYFVILSRTQSIRSNSLATVCAVVLGFLILWPRVISLTIPDITLQHLNTYFTLDKKKNRTARKLLVNYYNNLGDSTRAAEERERWDKDFPERRLFWQACYLEQQGETGQAVSLFRQVVATNPAMADGWSHIGACYGRLGMSDSAVYYCTIATGYNPYDQSAYNNLGANLSRLGRYQEAEDALLKAYSLSDSTVVPLYNIASIARLRGQRDKYEHYIRRSGLHPAAPPRIVMELVEYYMQFGRLYEAKDVLARTMGKTVDSTHIKELVEKYPDVKW